jgi:hypothetical protein
MEKLYIVQKWGRQIKIIVPAVFFSKINTNLKCGENNKAEMPGMLTSAKISLHF